MTDVAEADIQRAWERVQITGNPWRMLNTCGFVRAMLHREEPQWQLWAYDLDRAAIRAFALRDADFTKGN